MLTGGHFFDCINYTTELGSKENGAEMTYGGRQPVERRANTRRDARMPIAMNLPNTSSVISGRTQNISSGGMKVKTEITPSPLKIKCEVSFLVNREYLKLQGQGRILWTSAMGSIFGIQFTQLDEESRKSLKEFFSLFVDVPTRNS